MRLDVLGISRRLVCPSPSGEMWTSYAAYTLESNVDYCMSCGYLTVHTTSIFLKSTKTKSYMFKYSSDKRNYLNSFPIPKNV